ncbi:hypothetical protein ACS4N0_10920 [Levilactobacillus zymae]|uniref:hypothetical protein n=1 Tax=Levilactobacillus zymae TaxID=267363 RepID=UPI003FCC3358
MRTFLKWGLALLCGDIIWGGTPLAHAQTELPGSLVKVGHYTASTDYLNLSEYYQTTRKTTVTVQYRPTYHAGKTQQRRLTLPQGTTVAGYLTTQKVDTHLQQALLVYSSRLSYALLSRAQPKGYTVDPIADTDATPTVISGAQLTAFKRVPCPKYMVAYSHGDLYAGGIAAALSPAEPTGTSLRITPDGVVELLSYDANTNANLEFYQRPDTQAKITRTNFHDPYRDLYFAHDLRGFNLRRVSRTGTQQYKLTIENLHQPQHILGNPLKGVAGTFDSLYLVSGVPYYTFIGFDGASN